MQVSMHSILIEELTELFYTVVYSVLLEYSTAEYSIVQNFKIM